MYLRALWARDFFLRPTSGDFEHRDGYKPYIENYLIYIPDAYDDYAGVSGLELYRATAAHCAAHVVYTQRPISAEDLNPLQMAAISVIEDARVEQLAVAAFPGLRQLWVSLHTITPTQSNTLGDYLNRIARALLDASYVDEHPVIVQTRLQFSAEQHRLTDNQLSWDIGVTLAHALSQLRIPFQLRTDVLSSPCRDDNRCFWEFTEFDFNQAQAAGYHTIKQVRKYVSVMEMANEIDCELAGDDAQEIWILATELFPYEDAGISFNDMEGKESVSDPYHYPEWDYQLKSRG